MGNVMHAAVISHKGCERDNNEDNFFFNGDLMPLKHMDAGAFIVQDFTQSKQLYAICDGMGGGNQGERASYLCAWHALALQRQMNPGKMKDQISQYALTASQAVLEDARKGNAGLAGTTMALLAFCKQSAWVANVGDSRVYLLRDGKLQQVSYDHSEVNDLCHAGLLTEEEARKSPRNNIITRYVGMDVRKDQDFTYQKKKDTRPGDRWMLCSDGLSDLLPSAQICQVLRDAKSPESAVKTLVNTALELSGKDNVTVIVVDVA